MNEFDLLAPGPSMSPDLAASLRGRRVGVVGNCFELAPWAEFVAANDLSWWAAYPAAMKFAGRRFSSHKIVGVEQLQSSRHNWNSGVLALAVAAWMGATVVRLHGFDMHGSHYFGPYENGLRNTPRDRREVHKQQYAQWGRQNRSVSVINCTPGSALTCFPFHEPIAA